VIYECHGHIIADGISYAGAMERHKNGVDESLVRDNLRTAAAWGVGFYRDGGDKYYASQFAKSVAAEYGIDYRTPICIIHKNGYYGHMYGFGYDNIREYRALVADVKKRGADFIKLAVSGMLDFAGDGGVIGPSVPTDELRELTNIAHGEGFRVMAHVNGAENIKNALLCGVDSVEHGFWADNECAAMLRDTGAVWVPTCVTVKNIIGCGRYDDTVLTSILRHHESALKYASGLGVLIASGSDCGAYRVYHGAGTDDECAELSSLGVSTDAGNAAIAERFRRL
jgi:hypothetical protein